MACNLFLGAKGTKLRPHVTVLHQVAYNMILTVSAVGVWGVPDCCIKHVLQEMSLKAMLTMHVPIGTAHHVGTFMPHPPMYVWYNTLHRLICEGLVFKISASSAYQKLTTLVVEHDWNVCIA